MTDIYEKAEKNNCNIIIPEDCYVSTDFDGNGIIKKHDEIGENEMILDIGPKTIKNIEKKLINQKQFYGMDLQDILKMKAFSIGTLAIANKISEIL